MNHSDDPLPQFSQVLRLGLADLIDPARATFLDMLHEDASMEFPFAPEGATRKLTGKEKIREHLKSLGGILRFTGFTVPAIHSARGGVVVLEFSGSATVLSSSQPYHQDYVSVITLHEGMIVHYRDYWNPLVVLQTKGFSL